MNIRTRRQIWFFAVSVTIISLAAAEILNVVLFPPEILSYTLPGTAVIVVLVTMPICLWIGRTIRNNGVLSMQLRQVVNRDRLTNVGSRDLFFKSLERQPGIDGVMLLIDVDNLKRINDTYGHLTGDEVIKAIATVLRKETRDHDLVCRFGGDGMVVFFPQTSLQEAFEMAERLRVKVEATVVMAGKHPVRATISVGGALKHRAVDTDTVLREADAALYRAKAQGRNRTIFAATPPIAPRAAV